MDLVGTSVSVAPRPFFSMTPDPPVSEDPSLPALETLFDFLDFNPGQ